MLIKPPRGQAVESLALTLWRARPPQLKRQPLDSPCMLVRVTRLEPIPPLTLRARVWSDGAEDHASAFSDFLLGVTPPTDARLSLGWDPTDKAYIASLDGRVTREQLPEVLARCEGENLQLAWSMPHEPLALVVICEFYDDHVEIAAGPTLAPALEAALRSIEAGAV